MSICWPISTSSSTSFLLLLCVCACIFYLCVLLCVSVCIPYVCVCVIYMGAFGYNLSVIHHDK